MSRLDRWKEPVYILTLLGSSDEGVTEFINSHWAKRAASGDPGPDLSETAIIGAARELIFELRDGSPFFTAVMYSLDTQRLQIEIAPTLEILPPEDLGEDEVSEHMRHILALAAAQEVPVYPNTDQDEPFLLRYHREMLINGFTAPDSKGERVRLQLTRSPGLAVDTTEYFDRVALNEWISPADVGLIRQVVRSEIRKREEAGKVLAALRAAIEGLSALLEAKERNEGALQIFLTQHPILFGTEYTQVIPKHRLGAEYELDYAIVRPNGLVDLIEIEASTHSLFTKSGNPSQHLVHAEQQVLDWIDWIEQHGEYARSVLPGLVSPVGYIVIGRGNSLTTTEKRRLVRRNLMFQGKLTVLTYDDLLTRAGVLLERLLGGAERHPN